MSRVFLAMMFVGVSFLFLLPTGGTTGNGISVVASDFQFEPHTWTIPAGEEVSLSLSNNGIEEHEWVLLKLGQDVSLPFSEDDERKIFWEIEADPGKTVQSSFTAPSRPGTYRVICGKKEHIEKGMSGIVTIHK